MSLKFGKIIRTLSLSQNYLVLIKKKVYPSMVLRITFTSGRWILLTPVTTEQPNVTII